MYGSINGACKKPQEQTIQQFVMLFDSCLRPNYKFSEDDDAPLPCNIAYGVFLLEMKKQSFTQAETHCYCVNVISASIIFYNYIISIDQADFEKFKNKSRRALKFYSKTH